MNNSFERWWSEEGFWFCRQHDIEYDENNRHIIEKLYGDAYVDGYGDAEEDILFVDTPAQFR